MNGTSRMMRNQERLLLRVWVGVCVLKTFLLTQNNTRLKGRQKGMDRKNTSA